MVEKHATALLRVVGRLHPPTLARLPSVHRPQQSRQRPRGGYSAGSTKKWGKIDPLKLRVPTPISGVTNAVPGRRQSALLDGSVRLLVRELEIRQVGQSARTKKEILMNQSGSALAILHPGDDVTPKDAAVVRRTRTLAGVSLLLAGEMFYIDAFAVNHFFTPGNTRQVGSV